MNTVMLLRVTAVEHEAASLRLLLHTSERADFAVRCQPVL
jgi:hypothetical protein